MAVAQMGGGYYGSGYGMMGGGTGWMVVGWLFMILFWVAVILLVVWLVRQLKGPTAPAVSGETALDILKKRYASGEITKDEYEEMKKELG